MTRRRYCVIGHLFGVIADDSNRPPPIGEAGWSESWKRRMMIGVGFGHSVEQSVGRAADGATPFICVRVMGRRVAAQVRSCRSFTPVLFATIRPTHASNTGRRVYSRWYREACQPGRVVHFPLKVWSNGCRVTRSGLDSRNVETERKLESALFKTSVYLSCVYSLLLGSRFSAFVSLKIRFWFPLWHKYIGFFLLFFKLGLMMEKSPF